MKQPEFSQSLFFKLTLPLHGLFIIAGKIADASFEIPFASRSFSDKKHSPFKVGFEDEIDRFGKSINREEKELQTIYLAMIDDLKNTNKDINDTCSAALQEWSGTLELHEHKMEKKHISRVTKYVQEFARYMGLSEQEIVNLRRGAFLHDFGKKAIPDHILKKQGPLSAEEWGIMRQHPLHGYSMLLAMEYSEHVLDIPYCHHERWDGLGYPRELQGTEIPLSARVFSVVDVWDSLTSHQPYRKAWTQEEALAYIRSNSGQEFDPDVVEKFFEWIETKNFEIKNNKLRLVDETDPLI